MVTLGVPYGAAEKQDARGMARAQAEQIAAEIVQKGGPAGLENKDVIALIAYMQRLGVDIKAQIPAAPPAQAAAAPATNQEKK
jgi:cytochrome c oxidase cbb3-type subunit I/II